MRIVGLLLVSAVLLLHVAPTDSRELGCFNAKRVYKFFKTRVPVGTRKFASRCGVKCRNTAGKFTYFALERDTKKCTCLSRPKMSFFKGLRPYRKRPCGKSGNVKLYRFPKAPGKSKRRPIRRKFPRRKIRRDRCPTRYGYKKRKTGCYAVFQQAFTWPEAAIFCFVEGARLVEINNKKKNKDVAALAKTLRKDVWIGANDIIQENALRFIGTNRGVKAFFKKKIGNNKRKNCVKLSANSKWRSSNCNNRRPFICERIRNLVSGGPRVRPRRHQHYSTHSSASTLRFSLKYFTLKSPSPHKFEVSSGDNLEEILKYLRYPRRWE